MFSTTNNAIYKFNYGGPTPICYQPYNSADYQRYVTDTAGKYLFTVTGYTGVVMIDTTTFETRTIDAVANYVIDADSDYVYTQREDKLVKKIKFTSAWEGIDTDTKEFTFPMGADNVRLGNSYLIGKYGLTSGRYVIVKTADMSSYELDLESSHEFTIGIDTIGIVDFVSKKIKFYTLDGVFLNAVDYSNESTWEYGIKFWVDRYYGPRTVTNVGIMQLTESATSVLIKVGSLGQEVLDHRLTFVRSNEHGQYEPFGINGAFPYGRLHEGLKETGVWTSYQGQVFYGLYSSVTTLCVPETEVPTTATPTEAPETQAPETPAPETEVPTTATPTTTTAAPVPGVATTTAAPGVTTTTTLAPTKAVTSAPTSKPNTPTTTKAATKTTTAAPTKDTGSTNDPYIISIRSNATTVVAGFVLVLVAILAQFL